MLAVHPRPGMKPDSFRKCIDRTIRRAMLVREYNADNGTSILAVSDLPRPGPVKTVSTPINIDRVRKIGRNAGMSAPEISNRSGQLGDRIGVSTTRRILKNELNLKPFKGEKVVNVKKP